APGCHRAPCRRASSRPRAAAGPQPAPPRTGSTTRSRAVAAQDRLREPRRRDGVIAGPSEDPFVRSAPFPRRVLFLATLIAAGSLADPALAQDISINLGQGNGGVTERAIQLIALLTV